MVITFSGGASAAEGPRCKGFPAHTGSYRPILPIYERDAILHTSSKPPSIMSQKGFQRHVVGCQPDKEALGP